MERHIARLQIYLTTEYSIDELDMVIRHHHQQSTNTSPYSLPHVPLNGRTNGIPDPLLFLSGVVPNSLPTRLARDPRSWFGPPPDIGAARRRLGLAATVMREVIGTTGSSCASCESPTICPVTDARC